MEDRRAMYAFFGVLVAFKLFTIILIFALLTSWSTLAFLVLGHFLWLAFGAVVLWSPALFWFRLRRVRRRRRALQSAEWNVGEIEPTRR
jgi:type IV secretory pathway VirB3-like protein